MKSQYSIDVEHSLIHKRHVGDITVEQEIEFINLALSDPLYRKGMDSLCDFSEAVVNWSLDDLDRFRAYVTRIKKVTGKCKWAIIFPSGKDNSTARMFVALHEAFEDTISVKLFTTHEEALSWLEEVNALL